MPPCRQDIDSSGSSRNADDPSAQQVEQMEQMAQMAVMNPISEEDQRTRPILSLLIFNARDIRTDREKCACFITYGKTTVRTSWVRQAQNPEWNQSFRFVLSEPTGSIQVVLKDQDVQEGLLTFEDLGQVSIPVQRGFVEGCKGWYELRSAFDDNGRCGEVQIELGILNSGQDQLRVLPSTMRTQHHRTSKAVFLNLQKRQFVDKQLLLRVNEMVVKLENRDTQDLAMNFLKDTIIDLKPQLFAAFFKSLVANMVRACVRACVRVLVAAVVRLNEEDANNACVESCKDLDETRHSDSCNAVVSEASSSRSGRPCAGQSAKVHYAPLRRRRSCGSLCLCDSGWHDFLACGATFNNPRQCARARSRAIFYQVGRSGFAFCSSTRCSYVLRRDCATPSEA